MFKIKVNDTFSYDIEQDKAQYRVNGQEIKLDIHKIDRNRISILHNNKSYSAEVVELNKEEKTCLIKVNGNNYSLVINDQFDELLHRLGMDKLAGSKISEQKAPMPGLVLNVCVSVGDEVKKGDNLLVLEAMKMENIIKSPADLRVKSLKVKPGDKVEKNQVLISFE
ncbi:MAG TPA: biotin/lipoyl-containing protein [Sphingobacteriaceae bacterium]